MHIAHPSRPLLVGPKSLLSSSRRNAASLKSRFHWHRSETPWAQFRSFSMTAAEGLSSAEEEAKFGFRRAEMYGYVTPDDVPDLLDQHVSKGLVIERLWRGQMGGGRISYIKGEESGSSKVEA
ncbi:hypothetical protein SAY87_023016 [Trapa incisa]|uniref:Uncharacterized protein n=1 Tax=Trapa incisa TaxID=236973 RepID=A0AAN7K3L5_9MYRT|nr:hypothetical protein SAY87_023016 [Trapa incisa]